MSDDTIIKLIGWSDEEIEKLDKINTSWIIVTDRYIRHYEGWLKDD